MLMMMLSQSGHLTKAYGFIATSLKAITTKLHQDGRPACVRWSYLTSIITLLKLGLVTNIKSLLSTPIKPNSEPNPTGWQCYHKDFTCLALAFSPLS